MNSFNHYIHTHTHHQMNRTQKNKATEHHIGLLKARLARLRSQLIEDEKSGGGGGTGFEARKAGDARVALVGFPSGELSLNLLMFCNTMQFNSSNSLHFTW